MPVKSWTLTDLDTQQYIDEISLAAADLGLAGEGISASKKTLRGGLSDGVDVVSLNNGKLAIDVLPTRGMNIWKAWIGGLELGWKSPVRGPVHPNYVPLMEPSGLGWLDGFDELFVRCGLESNGAPDFDDDGKLAYPLHGKIANLPAHKVELTVDSDAGELRLTGVVDESRFHFAKLRLTTTLTMKVGDPAFHIHDVIENLSASPAGMQMLYHVNFGVPLLDGGSSIIAPIKTVVPRNAHAAAGIENWSSYAAEEAGFEEQVYFLELLGDENGNTEALLKNAHATQGVSLQFNKSVLPCFSVWKNTTAREDGYVTGIEPGTNFPNPRTFEAEKKRVVELPAGKSIAFDVKFTAHANDKGVQAAAERIAKLQGQHKPTIYDEPQAGWCS
ncbi:MAG: hypothetical protein ACI9G1_003944 [Pirellulaceae bacterium]|jgi:hypothetical protein